MLTFRLLTSALLAANLAHAGQQTNQADTVFAPILRTERASAGVVRVVYDLRGVMGTAFAVALEASDDGGQTYTVRPRALTGDVGPRVSPGAEKTIVWDSTKDVDDLQVDRYVFRVRVSPSGAAAAAASPPARGATAPPAGRGAAGGAPGGGTTAGAKKGGPGKGALIAIAGGGAAAASIGVAAAKSRGGATTPDGPGTPPQNVAARTYTSPFTVPFLIVVTSPTGTNPCSYSISFNGTLSMTVQVTAGSVSGTAIVNSTQTTGTTNCTTSTGALAPTPGTTSTGVIAADLAVTGTPSSLSFRGQTVVMGTDASGQIGTATKTVSFSGALGTDSISGSLTLTFHDDTNGGTRMGNGTASVAVTLR